MANLAKLSSDMDKAQQTVDKSMRNIDKSVTLAKNAFAGLAGALGIGSIIKLSDEYKRFDSQLKLATKSTKDYETAYARVISIARTSQSDIGTIGVLYARLTNNLREFGTSQKDIGNITESVALSLRVSNATVQETNSVMLQLSQSFGSGRINGQEFLAVSEGAPIIMRQLAKSLNVTYGELKNLSAEGKLTSEALSKALTDPEYLKSLQEQVKAVGTISSAMTVFTNNLKVFIGEADKANGAGKLLANTIIFLGDNLNTLANIGLVYLAVQISKSIQAFNLKIVSMANTAKQAVITGAIEREESARTAALEALNAERAIAMDKLKILSKIRVAEAKVAEAESSVVASAGLAKEANAMKVLEAETYKLIQAKGQLAKVNGVVAVSLANNASASTMLAAKNAQLASSASTATSALTAKASALGALRGLLTAFGGWVGLAVTAIILFGDKIFNFSRESTTELGKVKEIARQLNVELSSTPELIAKKSVTSLEELAKVRADLQKELERREKTPNNIFSNEFDFSKGEFVTNQERILEIQQQLDASLVRYNELIVQKVNAEKSSVKVVNEQIEAEKRLREANIKFKSEEIAVQRKIIEDAKIAKISELDRIAIIAEATKKIKELTSTTKEQSQAQEKAQEALTKQRLGAIQHEYEVKARTMEDLLDRTAEHIEIEEKLKKEQFEADKKRIAFLQDAANDNFKQAQDNLKELAKEQERVSDAFSRSLTDALFRGFESGKSFAENFKDTLINSFKTLVLQPIVRFLVDSSGLSAVLGSIGGAFSGGAQAGTASGGGIGSVLGTIKDFFSGGNSSIIGGIESLAARISNGLGGIRDTIGGFLGQNAGLVANLSAFSGAALSLVQGDVKGAAFQGAGAGLGLALGGPIGGAIGSFLGGALGGAFGGKKQPPRTVTQLPEVGAAFAGSLNALLGGFGLDANATASASYKGRGGGSGYGTLSTNINGVSRDLYTRDKGAYSQASLEGFVNRVLTTELIAAIQSSELSAGVKKFFNDLVDKESIAEAIQTLTTLNSALKDLPPVFDNIRQSIDTVAYKTPIAQLQQQFAGLNTFTSLFYTEAENFKTFTKQLTSGFAAINMAIPATRQEYRKLVEQFEVTDEATNNQYSALIALAPALDTYYNQLGQQLNAVNALNAALDINRFRTFTDFVIANAYQRQGLDIPAANMPSYAVGTDYVPNTGMAMLHQGEAVLTRSDNASMGQNTSNMVNLLNSVVTELRELKYDLKRTADGTQRTARELEDITGGDVVLLTEAA